MNFIRVGDEMINMAMIQRATWDEPKECLRFWFAKDGSSIAITGSQARQVWEMMADLGALLL